MDNLQVDPTTRGPRQGDPIILKLFVVVMEEPITLLEYDEIEDNVKGLQKKGATVNHILFVDDVMFFFQNQTTTLYKILRELFAEASRLQPNMKKTISFSEQECKILWEVKLHGRDLACQVSQSLPPLQ